MRAPWLIKLPVIDCFLKIETSEKHITRFFLKKENVRKNHFFQVNGYELFFVSEEVLEALLRYGQTGYSFQEITLEESPPKEKTV